MNDITYVIFFLKYYFMYQNKYVSWMTKKYSKKGKNKIFLFFSYINLYKKHLLGIKFIKKKKRKRKKMVEKLHIFFYCLNIYKTIQFYEINSFMKREFSGDKLNKRQVLQCPLLVLFVFYMYYDTKYCIKGILYTVVFFYRSYIRIYCNFFPFIIIKYSLIRTRERERERDQKAGRSRKRDIRREEIVFKLFFIISFLFGDFFLLLFIPFSLATVFFF